MVEVIAGGLLVAGIQQAVSDRLMVDLGAVVVTAARGGDRPDVALGLDGHPVAFWCYESAHRASVHPRVTTPSFISK
jgi:hypothetical protein